MAQRAGWSLAHGLTLVAFLLVLAVLPTRAQEPAAPPAAAPAPLRPARLQGSVKLERNRPVVGAAVTVIPEAGDGPLIVTTTDSRGTFRVDDVPDGAYTVVFERSGLDAVRKQHVELKAPFRPTVEVVMKPGTGLVVAAPQQADTAATVAGIAGDRDGGSVSDLKVRLLPAKGDTDPRETVTDAAGAFELTDVPPGPWTLEARGLAYLPVRATLPLAGGTLRVRLVLVPQPPAFDPLPEDLLPPEEPIPPPGSQEPDFGFTAK